MEKKLSLSYPIILYSNFSKNIMLFLSLIYITHVFRSSKIGNNFATPNSNLKEITNLEILGRGANIGQLVVDSFFLSDLLFN